ncbi:MAG: hypothetical protein HOM14_08975 [Gammaproteobacteria bacterium]|jgi:hypothetical protein|nr:hypothetical protein [Gammaproteobacteria bacterium]MBT4077172.1 hypothetical protein [Gammaproteobacteria bacterium]MBT4195824.1 hypothetical protein [Gammaproteobacteria bacterium]MBT4448932.1 hypothetical protein [Gammaproteobacteria bacterium]MBT4861594.1 hypothetical protein [Gammaproteobacteria bacterium]
MNTAFLLILLTTNGNGLPAVSFVNTESKALCKGKQNMITAIFKAGNIIIDQSHCIPSKFRFSKYSHNPSSSASRYFWFLDLSAGSEKLISMPDMSSCHQHVKRIEKDDQTAICAVTDQSQVN